MVAGKVAFYWRHTLLFISPCSDPACILQDWTSFLHVTVLLKNATITLADQLTFYPVFWYSNLLQHDFLPLYPFPILSTGSLFPPASVLFPQHTLPAVLTFPGRVYTLFLSGILLILQAHFKFPLLTSPLVESPCECVFWPGPYGLHRLCWQRSLCHCVVFPHLVFGVSMSS